MHKARKIKSSRSKLDITYDWNRERMRERERRECGAAAWNLQCRWDKVKKEKKKKKKETGIIRSSIKSVIEERSILRIVLFDKLNQPPATFDHSFLISFGKNREGRGIKGEMTLRVTLTNSLDARVYFFFLFRRTEYFSNSS